MSYQLYFNIALIILSVALTVLLIVRSRQAKRQLAVIKKMKLDDYFDFLFTNSSDGSIVEVAKRLSDLLINSFDCQYIVFIRKKRGAFDLNYYHGIRSFNKTDFHLDHNSKLEELFCKNFRPQPIEILEKFLPDGFKQKLARFGIDLFFPVFWRENLYGVYFIKSTPDIKSTTFDLMIASMAQSLSAAYHIKWHESKQDNLQQKIKTADSFKAKTTEGDQEVLRILNLVRHKRTETVIPKIIEAFKEITAIDEVVLIQQIKEDNIFKLSIRNDFKCNLNLDDMAVFNELYRLTANQPIVNLDQLKSDNKITEKYLDTLKSNGVRILAGMNLTKNGRALVGLPVSPKHGKIQEYLTLFNTYMPELVANAELFERFENLSYTDNLTGLANQRYFMKRLNEEINRAARYKRKLALIIFDVDELKAVNDRHGHLAGDELIARMGDILRKSIRAIDVVARYGGDEFCVIMPEADLDTVEMFMDRLLKKINNTKFNLKNAKETIDCTLSMGAAIFPDHADEVKKLIHTADMALLEAKDAGRNKFIISSPKQIS